MGSERILADAATSDVLAERRRLTGLLMIVVDDLIHESATVAHPVARALLGGFAAEMVRLRKAIREAWSENEFRLRRELEVPEAEEVPGYAEGDAEGDAGAKEQGRG